MRHIASCLNPKLAHLCQQSIKLETFNEIIKRFLPKELQSYCKVGSFNQGRLQLIVADSAWASQLRYMLPELRDKLRREAKIFQLSSIKLTIQPETDIKSQ